MKRLYLLTGLLLCLLPATAQHYSVKPYVQFGDTGAAAMLSLKPGHSFRIKLRNEPRPRVVSVYRITDSAIYISKNKLLDPADIEWIAIRSRVPARTVTQTLLVGYGVAATSLIAFLFTPVPKEQGAGNGHVIAGTGLVVGTPVYLLGTWAIHGMVLAFTPLTHIDGAQLRIRIVSPNNEGGPWLN